MKTTGIILSAMLMVFSINLNAQNNKKNFGFELSGGASLATSEMANAEMNTGFGFEGIFHYNFIEHTGVYAGWGWNHFASDESFAGENTGFEETGYVFGLQFKHPLKQLPISWYLRVGGLYNHIEIENAEGEIILDSGHGFGWQAATGVDIKLGSNWSLTPGVKFNSLSREISTEGAVHNLNHNYVQIRLGILKRF